MNSKSSGSRGIPLKWPTRRLEDTKSIYRSLKNCDRKFSTLSLSCNLDPNLDKLNFLKKTSKLFKKVKYAKSLKISRDPLYTPHHINKFLSQIKRLNTTKELKLICSNSNIGNRISRYSTLKCLKRFNRLNTAVLHIFFAQRATQIFEKFGLLIQSFRVKSLTIKEPLAFIPERYVKRFYAKLRHSGKGLIASKFQIMHHLQEQLTNSLPISFLPNPPTYLNFTLISLESPSKTAFYRVWYNL